MKGYGLEPNYGCCTANMHQGWPKLSAHLWMRAAGNGIACVAYAPSEVSFEVAGTPVRVVEETDYPFREEVSITVTADRPVRFPLLVRVPGWTLDARCSVAGGTEKGLKAGSFFRIERQWEGTTQIHLTFPMAVKTTRRYNEAMAARTSASRSSPASRASDTDALQASAHRGVNDYNDPNSEFCFQRSVQGGNVAIFWSKEYGVDPVKNPDPNKTFDVKSMLSECERYYSTYVDDLKPSLRCS